MKSNKKINPLLLCFLPICMFSIFANAADIELTIDSDNNLPVNLSDPSSYTLDGETYSGEIDTDTNITVNYDYSASAPSSSFAKFDSSTTAGNFTYNILSWSANTWSKEIFFAKGSQTMSFENMYVNLYGSLTTHPFINISTWSGSSLNVRGDFVYSDRRTDVDFYQTKLSLNGTEFNIGGDFKMESQIVPSSTYMGGVILYVNSTRFTVGGVLIISNVSNDENVFRMQTSTIQLGGLQVSQNGFIQLSGNTGSAQEILFTNSGTGEYIGGLLTRDSDGKPADNKLNVRMTASDAANGRQIMRFSATEGFDGYIDSPNALNEVEVNSGRLDLGMYGGMKGGSLMIMGYNNPSEAVFSATGTAAGTEIGRVVFDTMSFYRGTVVFDLAETDGDFIQVDGAMTKVTGASLVLELNVSAYDLQAWLEASGIDEWNANLMSFATDGSNVTADDFTLKLQDGITGKITISELDGVSTITANLSLVPEPAEIAAILGAFALLLAARRRRG